MIWECSGNTNKNICLGTQTHGTKDQNHMVWEHKHRYQCMGPFWEHKHRGWSGNKDKVWDTKKNIRIWGWFRTQNKIALKDEEQDLRTITKRSRTNPSKEKLKLDLITDIHVLSLPWSRNDSRWRRCSSEITFEEDKSDKKASKDFWRNVQRQILTSLAHFSCFSLIDLSVNSSMNFALVTRLLSYKFKVRCKRRVSNLKSINPWTWTEHCIWSVVPLVSHLIQMEMCEKCVI